MTRRSTVILGVTLLLACALLLAGCEASGADLSLSATVVDDREVLSAPRLDLPTVVAAPRLRGQAAETTIAVLTRLGDMSRIASVPVEEGDDVAVGDPIVILDDASLRAEMRRQRAQLRLARARVALLQETLDSIRDKQAEVAEARAQVRSTIAELESTLVSLRATRANAARSLSRLEALRARLGSLPPGGFPGGGMPPGGFPTPRPSPNPTATPSPTGTPVPTGTPPPTPPVPATPPVPPMPALPDPAAIRAGIAQLDAGLGRLSSGLGQARAGLARLDDAAAQLADAKATVEDLRQLADIAADTQSIAVELAGVRREDAVVRAMSSGRVVESAEVGDVLAPGATVAVIAPASAAHVSTWVPVDAVRALEIGTEASVRTDSAPGKHFPARVTRVGEEAGYPPTSYATREVHLLRSVEVEFELTDPSVRLPRGTPATVEISRFQDEG